MSGKQELRDRIAERCEAAGLAWKPVNFGPTIGRIKFPRGRETRDVPVREDSAKQLLALPFEEYSFLGNYQGVCSYERGEIEALLEIAGSGAPPGGTLRRRLREPSKRGVPVDMSGEAITVAGSQGVALSLGAPSKLLRSLLITDRIAQVEASISLRISGLSITRHDSALDALATLGNSFLFQLDGRLNFSMLLRRMPEGRFHMPRRRAPVEVEFPASEFDPEPMSLFWYGRGARGLPLLEFFAYYQVLEFYFGQFAEQEARQRIKALLKNPSFSPHNDREIGRVLRAASGIAGKGSRDERSQLRATIQGCADPDDIREYIVNNEERRKFFETKEPDLTDQVIRPTVSDQDFLGQVADRIYDIRCRIVHTKDDGGDDDLGLLLPFSPAARKLNRDIDLLERIARQALVHASRPLVIDS